MYVFVYTRSLQPFLRRRKYKLYAAFMHATAIKPADKPVAFEVSIGKRILHMLQTHTHTVHAMKRFTFYSLPDACRFVYPCSSLTFLELAPSVRPYRSVCLPVHAPYVLTRTPIRRYTTVKVYVRTYVHTAR